MKYKTVVQLTSGEDEVIKGMASQINNLQKALNNDVSIEVYCHGRSHTFVLDEDGKWSGTIRQLLAGSVEIFACENMLQSNKKNIEDLFPGIKTVPAAIATIVVKQQEGWSYIKAGF